MGSFTELKLEFTLDPVTPAEVLAAFGQFRTSDEAPAVPSLEDLLGGKEELERVDMKVDDYLTEDDFVALPLLHKSVAWRNLVNWGECAYLPGHTFCILSWDPLDELWTVMTRTVPKMSEDEVRMFVEPLGAFASDGTPESPASVGSVLGEHADGPVQVLSVGREPFRFA